MAIHKYISECYKPNKYQFRAILIGIFALFSSFSFGQNQDYQILKSIHQNRNQNLDPLFHSISASTGWLAIAYPVGLGTAGLLRKDSTLLIKSLSAGLGLGLSASITYLLKVSIERKRPFESHPEIISPYSLPQTTSFPSGHTSTAFETATHLSLNFRKWYFVVPAYAWAGSVAYARLHEGIHYPSDVIAGAILGSTCAWLSFKTNKWLVRKTVKIRRRVLKE
jgi:membrane-associated phospholipid phosphatase